MGLFGKGKGHKASNQAAHFAELAALEKQRLAGDLANQYNQMGEQYARDIYKESTQYTPKQLQMLDEQYKSTSNQLAREQKLLDSIDPTLMEASQQALKLIRGEESSTMNPLKNQRAQQRQALMNRLREQYGAGAESSSLGIKALTQFDSETANIFNGAQQQGIGTLSQLMGVSAGSRPDMLRTSSMLGGIAQGYGAIANQGANALAQGGQMRLGALMQGGQNRLDTAGAQYVYETQSNMARAQQSAANRGAVMNVAGGAIGAGMGALMGGGMGASMGKTIGEGVFSGGQQQQYTSGPSNMGMNYNQSPANFWGVKE